MLDDVALLQERFAEVRRIEFFKQDELIGIHVNNTMASATVLLQGAQVLQFTPHNKPRLIWHSKAVEYKRRKPLRGGIPICWPWFGPVANNPQDLQEQCAADAPQHGFARNENWTLEEAENLDSGATVLRFGLTDSDATLAWFKREFYLQLEVTIARELHVALKIHNKEKALPLVCTGALHSYFAIYDINKTRLYGLDNLSYVDSTDEGAIKTQQGPVVVNAETDRIYFVDDNHLQDLPGQSVNEQQIKCTDRKIYLRSNGSRSVVVWNPWIEKARSLSQFVDDEYVEMLCVETANAHNDVIKLAPGETHILEVRLGYSE